MKVIKTGDEARASMKIGIDTAVDLAKVTLGGKGRIVMIDTPSGLHPTLDGITIIANTELEDYVENMGVKIVQESAIEQDIECGDGTTSVSVVLQAIINGGMKNIAAGADPLLLKKGIELAAEKVILELNNLSTPVKRNSKEILQVATVSAHGDTSISSLVAEAIAKTGEDSRVVIERSPWTESVVEVSDGIKYGGGLIAMEFITNRQKGTAELVNPLILIYEGKINSFKELVGTDEFPGIIIKANNAKRPLLIISDQLEGEPLSTLVANKLKGLQVYAINPSGLDRNDTKFRLQDLAIATGGKVISPDLGHRLDEVNLEDLGQAEKITIERDSTLFINGSSDKKELAVRVGELKQLIKGAKTQRDKKMLEARLSSISGGVGIVFIGGDTDGEVKERKDRADDALGSALSALENGVVPGGGISLLLAKKVLKDFTSDNLDVNTGIRILENSMEAPFRQIIANAGQKVDVVLNTIEGLKDGFGYNVVTEEYIDMVKEGILDPAKVEINIIRNATSVACRFISTEGLITTVPDKV